MNYRVVANKYEIESILEDGEFTTAASEDSIVVSGSKDKIITMLEALGINYDKLNSYE